MTSPGMSTYGSPVTSWRISSIGNSGARSSGPTGWPVPGCSGGGGGAGRSGMMLYQALGIWDSSRMNLVRSDTGAPPLGSTKRVTQAPYACPGQRQQYAREMPVVPELGPAVHAALDAGRPVVALESTIISHGLPRPENLTAAISFEIQLNEAGVTAATIALIDGVHK